MKSARRISQGLFLILFAVLFALSVGRLDLSAGGLRIVSPLPVELFLLIDPLLAGASMLSSRTFTPAHILWILPVVLLTILCGRAFCGWVCPLGTCIDAADRVARRKADRRTTRERSWPRLKYYILAGIIVTAAMGAQVAWLLDPQALLVRSLTLGAAPPAQWTLRSIEGVPALGQAAGAARGLFPEQQAAFRQGLIAALMLAAILAGGILSRRFWCRSLCPLGALLGLIGRIPLFRRSITPKCNECRLCEIDCKMDAISGNGAATVTEECIYCYSCVAVCPREGNVLSTAKPERSAPLNLSRRHLLTGIGVGAVWSFAARTAISEKATRDGTSRLAGLRLIRPPGSVGEDEFTELCVRCGECMKVCPTNGLQPALAEAGLAGIWTPVLAPRAGECTQKCTLCGDVCPTHAIQPFTVAEKDYLYIGRAAIDRSTCVVWESGKQCLVCDEVCSYDAIYWRKEGGTKMPHVDPARCVGCGICENNCPVGGPNAAIRVTCEGEKRGMPRDQQKAWRAANITEHPE